MSLFGKLRRICRFTCKECFGVRRPDELQDHVWLLSEQGHTAHDSGYAFFKFLKKNHPEITPIYVLTPDSRDFVKTACTGKVVAPGSPQHLSAIRSAEVLVSTEPLGFTPDPEVYEEFYRKGVFLPEGLQVLVPDRVAVSEDLEKKSCSPDLLVLSSDDEISIAEKLGYPKHKISVTGLPRFDMLTEEGKDEQLILIAPEWRPYLDWKTRREIRQGKWFCFYHDLLHSDRLKRALAIYGFKIVFLQCREAESLDLFVPGNDKTEIASLKRTNGQKLLQKASILVTDYSGLAYDAAYMGKDIVFTFCDAEKAEAEYGRRVPDPYRFGTVVEYIGDAEDAIIEAMEKPGQKKHEQESFFRYHDSRNCERLFAEISKRL